MNPALARQRWVRRLVNRAFGVLLIYQGIITGVAGIVSAIIDALTDVGDRPLTLNDLLQQSQGIAAEADGILSLAATAAGFLFLALVRRRDVFSGSFWAGGPHIDRDGRPMRYGNARMTPGRLMLLLGLMCTIQALLVLGQIGWNAITGQALPSPTSDDINDSTVAWLPFLGAHGAGGAGMADAAAVGAGGVAGAGHAFAGPLGLFDMGQIPAAMPAAASVTMTVYVWLVAPIVEEVLFRGVLMHELKPLGRNFAIFTSALAFGLFHDDVVQGLFAFCAGLVFGYVAMEYSVLWSIVLHAFNNGVLGGVLAYVFGLLPGGLGDFLYVMLLFGGGLASLIVLLAARRRELVAYMRANRTPAGLAGDAWGSPCLVVFVVINALLSVMLFVGALMGS